MAESLNTSMLKGFEIIEAFDKSGSPELTISQLAEITELSVSTTFRLAKTLVAAGYLHKNPKGKVYSLGWKFIKLLAGLDLLIQHLLITVGAEHLEKLSAQFNENATIYVRVHSQRLCLYRVEGTQEVRNIVKRGHLAPLIKGSPGKVLMAFEPEETWGRYFPQNDTGLVEELRQIREQGWSSTDEQQTIGASSISAPIFGPHGKIVAALTLSGPTFRFRTLPVEKKLAAIQEFSRKITEALKQSGHENGLG